MTFFFLTTHATLQFPLAFQVQMVAGFSATLYLGDEKAQSKILKTEDAKGGGSKQNLLLRHQNFSTCFSSGKLQSKHALDLTSTRGETYSAL